MFFKIASWNFQHLFEIEFRETSQLIQIIQTVVIFIFSIGCLIELKFCEVSRNSFKNRFWKFQLFILKNKKVLFLKKIKLLWISKQKSFGLPTQFSMKVLHEYTGILKFSNSQWRQFPGCVNRAAHSTHIRGFTKFGIKVLWKLQFLIGYRTLNLKFQKTRTKIEVVLSLPSWLSQLNWDS